MEEAELTFDEECFSEEKNLFFEMDTLEGIICQEGKNGNPLGKRVKP